MRIAQSSPLKIENYSVVRFAFTIQTDPIPEIYKILQTFFNAERSKNGKQFPEFPYPFGERDRACRERIAELYRRCGAPITVGALEAVSTGLK